MKKTTKILAATMATLCAFSLMACGNQEKNISVVVREASSGTREAFDKVVTDGEHYLQEKIDGKTVYNTTDTASIQTKTAAVLSTVETDENAIGYVSLGSVSDGVKVVSVEGVAPSTETVLDSSYQIQRPFVIMTNNSVTLTPLAADFMNYLQSSAMETHAQTADCIFLEEGSKRANEGETEIPVSDFQKQEAIPTSDKKIIIRGSTSMEKLIYAAAKGYATEYGISSDAVGDYFDIQLEGSSKGVSAVENDEVGNVIGLSSAAVKNEKISAFNVCLDAVAVIVNKNNTTVSNLTLKQLYEIFSGKVTKFSEIV